MQKIQAILTEQFPDPAIPLDHRNAFTFLVAVMLSASANDKKVNQVTPALFDLADTPEKMASLTVEKSKHSFEMSVCLVVNQRMCTERLSYS